MTLRGVLGFECKRLGCSEAMLTRPPTPTPQAQGEEEVKEEKGGGEEEQGPSAMTPLCPVCFERACDALLQPCHHISCCTPCAKQMKARKMACPRCNAKISQPPLTINW